MNPKTTRRDFLKTTAILGSTLAITTPWPAAAEDKKPKRQLKKAIMWNTVGVKGSVMEKLKAIKQAGFDGVEIVSELDQTEVLAARDATGLSIPSVCVARNRQRTFSEPDAKVREGGLKGLQQALRDAKRYGATCVLSVPGKVTSEVSCEDCWQRSTAEIRKAIPLAEELNVKIAIENVWNDFITKPEEAVRYLEQFKSSAVGWYFDIGNAVIYRKPEEWIPLLGKRIPSVHIKEFNLDRAKKEGRNVININIQNHEPIQPSFFIPQSSNLRPDGHRRLVLLYALRLREP
jgi:L-ribulose-5-phosphate 3-epimerase